MDVLIEADTAGEGIALGGDAGPDGDGAGECTVGGDGGDGGMAGSAVMNGV